MGLGIVWGVACLVVLGSIVRGFEDTQAREIDGLGDSFLLCRLVYSPPGRTDGRFGAFVQLQDEDIENVRKNSRTIASISPKAFGFGAAFKIDGKRNEGEAELVGVDQHYADVCRVPVGAGGRWLTAEDVRDANRVAVLGPRAKRAIFGDEPCLGREIEYLPTQPSGRTLGGKLTVVGVLEDVEWNTGLWYASHQDLVLVPVSIYERWFSPGFTFFVVRPRTPELRDEALRELTAIFGARKSFPPSAPGAVTVYFDSLERRAHAERLFGVVRAFLTLVGGLILLLGSIGIANVILMSVTARTFEFGVRRALGAPRSWILAQVFLEGGIVCLASGVLGFGLGLAGLTLLERFDLPEGFARPVFDARTAAVAAIGLSLSALVAAGWPALRAARLEVVQALYGRSP